MAAVRSITRKQEEEAVQKAIEMAEANKPIVRDEEDSEARGEGDAPSIGEGQRKEEEDDKISSDPPGPGGLSLRIGISGTPGAGKSTFIESLGARLVSAGHRVAVLAVDPSSTRSGGSILGDKTRMERLTRDPNAYVHPSPSRGTLGGVGMNTSEAVELLELAGFDVIFVETVGVGQSEGDVDDMVDLFILLMTPATGDELQGIKRGIMELADILIVNKADGQLIQSANRTRIDHERALHHMRQKQPDWIPRALTMSALRGNNVEEVWKVMLEYAKAVPAPTMINRRHQQQHRWMWEQLRENLVEGLRNSPGVAELLAELEPSLLRGEITPRYCADRLIAQYSTDQIASVDIMEIPKEDDDAKDSELTMDDLVSLTPPLRGMFRQRQQLMQDMLPVHEVTAPEDIVRLPVHPVIDSRHDSLPFVSPEGLVKPAVVQRALHEAATKAMNVAIPPTFDQPPPEHDVSPPPAEPKHDVSPPAKPKRKPRKTWNARFADLVALHSSTDSWLPPTRTSLGRWARTQRRRSIQGDLTQDQIKLLVDQGVSWMTVPRELPHAPPAPDLDADEMSAVVSAARAIQTSYEEFKPVEEFPTVTDIEPKIAAPVEAASTQPSRVWKERFAEWREWHTMHPNTDPPPSSPPLALLADWVKQQRSSYHSGTIDEREKASLHEAGFGWHPSSPISKPVVKPTPTPTRLTWEEGISQLQAFNERNGHVYVSHDDPNTAQLASFVTSAAAALEADLLSPDRAEQLMALGYANKDFELARSQSKSPEVVRRTGGHLLSAPGSPKTAGEEAWELRYQQLEAFAEQHHTHRDGGASLMKVLEREPRLLWWLDAQRRALSEGRLKESKRERLRRLGLSF